ncbi:BofC N-terminal domain-containing protein [Alteribacillus sp. JSM 102045]|uniref:BofC N-terminal domain-containing protein n=1 Tax=Alteribacillus sp. JSM 102045 TaxID=1562101 RepID=UPI0035C039DC
MILSVLRFCIMLLITGFIFTIPIKGTMADNYHPGYPAIYEVILEKETSNGVVVTEKRYETVWAVEDFWNKYKNWELIDQHEDQIILKKPYEKH